MTKDEIRKKAQQFFEDHCTSGYGCCFETESVKKKIIPKIESDLIEVWNDAIEAASAHMYRDWINFGGNHRREFEQALKLDEVTK